MRAAIYARFSTEKQSEASTADQARICRLRAEAQGWEIVAVHADDGVSGSTPVDARPGGRALLADALARRFDVLLLEGLDRLSRDMVESERIVRRLEHRGIRIVGVADGYDSESAARKLTRCVRGLLNEVYLDDLRHKTHRGLAGKILSDYSAGGKSYGYRTVREAGGSRIEVEPEAAKWVRWIFEQYAAGWSVQRIAYRLNELAVPAPRSGTWAVSCIYGSPAKGTGILNNELYVGRLVWNRAQWVKDPDTGKRQRLERPRHEWQIRERPDLRIVSDELWQAVRARMDAPRHAGGRGRGRPVRTLFGGLLRCGICGGAVVAVDVNRYGCAAHKDRGASVCAGVAAPRRDTDRRLLGIVRDEIASSEAEAEMRRQLAAVIAERRERGRQADHRRRFRLAELDGEIRRLVDAIATIGVSPALQERLQAAERERASLLSAGPATEPQRHDIAALMRRFAELRLNLQAAIESDVERARRLLVRLLVDVRIVQDGEAVFADVTREHPARLLLTGTGGHEPMLLDGVAGARFCTRKRYRIR